MIADSEVITIGRLGSSYGVHGWLRVNSYTVPPENILTYEHWLILHARHWQSIEIEAKKQQGHLLLVKLQPALDREIARTYTNDLIGIHKNALPDIQQQADFAQYYWRDLIGLSVINQEGVEFGTVTQLLETGANDVIVVKGERERCIPYIKSVILEVNLQQKIIRVHWDKNF